MKDTGDYGIDARRAQDAVDTAARKKRNQRKGQLKWLLGVGILIIIVLVVLITRTLAG